MWLTGAVCLLISCQGSVTMGFYISILIASLQSRLQADLLLVPTGTIPSCLVIGDSFLENPTRVFKAIALPRSSLEQSG